VQIGGDRRGSVSRLRTCVTHRYQDLTNTGIAGPLVVSERTVEARVRHILTKLKIPESENGHRHVLAVLAHLRAVYDIP
jgi:hypothetical protein